QRNVVDFLFQQLSRNVFAERLFKCLHDLAGKLGQLAVNVDHRALNAVFVGESKALERDLQRDGDQDRVRGQLHKINLHVKGQQVGAELVGDQLVLQVLEFDVGSAIQFGERFQAVKLLGL